METWGSCGLGLAPCALEPNTLLSVCLSASHMRPSGTAGVWRGGGWWGLGSAGLLLRGAAAGCQSAHWWRAHSEDEGGTHTTLTNLSICTRHGQTVARVTSAANYLIPPDILQGMVLIVSHNMLCSTVMSIKSETLWGFKDTNLVATLLWLIFNWRDRNIFSNDLMIFFSPMRGLI